MSIDCKYTVLADVRCKFVVLKWSLVFIKALMLSERCWNLSSVNIECIYTVLDGARCNYYMVLKLSLVFKESVVALKRVLESVLR